MDPLPDDDQARASERDAEFLGLLGQQEFRLAACIHAMVPGWQDAEDVLQDTKVTLWREFPAYQAGSDFWAWAQQVARRKVRAFQRKRQHERLIFSDELVDALMEHLPRTAREEHRHQAAMLECSKRLGNEGWDLFRGCYGQPRKRVDGGGRGRLRAAVDPERRGPAALRPI
jgi:RNA polymerase sigma-70 factor (ECF subfamily)